MTTLSFSLKTAFSPKTAFAFGALLYAAAALPVSAQSAPVNHDADDASLPPARGREFIGVSVGAQALHYSGDHCGNHLLLGASLNGGGFLSKTNPFLKNLLLTGDIGIYSGDSTNDMLFARSDYSEDPTPGNNRQLDTVKRKNAQVSVPIFASLAYDFQLGNNLDLRIGPSLGVTFVSMESTFDGRTEVDGGVTYTDHEKKSASELLFSYGLTVGATWNFTRNFSVDLQGRVFRNTKTDFGAYRDYGDALGAQVNLGVFWRF